MFGFGRKDDTIVLKKTRRTRFVAIAFLGDGDVPTFERTCYFEFHTILNGKSQRKDMLSIQDTKTDAVVKTLKDMKVDTVVARAYGPRAMHALKNAGIRCCVFDGGPHAAINAYLKDALVEV